MDSSVILVFFLVFLIGFIFSRKKKHLPPGPFTIPYVGSVGFLKKLPSSRPQEVFTEEARRHGPIFKFNIANQTFIVINSFELIQEALVKNADTCSGRPDWFNKVSPFNKGEDGKFGPFGVQAFKIWTTSFFWIEAFSERHQWYSWFLFYGYRKSTVLACR